MIWRVITFWLLGASFAVADFPRHSHVFAYNNGMAAGPGILTQMGDANPNLGDWTGGVSPFSRVNTETNTCTGYSAYGEVNGESTLEAWLDGQPLSVTTNSSYDPLYPIRWAAQMQLTPGAHQLKVAALHPSGFYTAWATNSFTNNVAHETTAIYRDYNGNIEQRIWTDTNGAQLHLQDLAWDTKNRLTDVTDVDGSYNGFYWHAEYDGLDRRLLTEYWVMTNGVAQIAGVTPFTINQYYDPQVEFLELGVSYDNQTTWKLYGPDLDGQYGGLNGTGGLDGVSPYLSLFNPVISDVRGNILAEVTNGVVVWNTSRPTGYGAQPGFQPVALGHGADVAQSSAWRGRWLDITGYYNIGLRPYNPVAGNWLSYDSTWNERDPNYLTFSGDDPINFFDPDGRCRTPLEGLDRMLSPYNFPGTPGTGYSLGAFNQIAGNDPSAYDEFDQMFARNIANGTSMYPYGYLGPEALQEAVNRGYVNDWDLPLIYSQDSHGTFVFKTGGQVVQDAFLAITTSAFLGAVTAEGSQAIESTIESTSRGAQPVFWSGGQTAEAAARTFANANNGIVIGDTVAGQELSAATEGVPWSQARPQWLQLSQNFANTASGEVNVFQNSQGVFLNSIWRDEYQTLINNPNVTGINFHVVMPNGSVVPVH